MGRSATLGMRMRPVVAGLVAVGAIIVADVRAQNLVPHGEFDDGLSDWVMSSSNNGGELVLDTSSGHPLAPSMLMHPGGRPYTIADHACIEIDSSQAFDVHAWLNRDPQSVPQPSVTGVSIGIFPYAQPACEQALGAGSGFGFSYDDCPVGGADGWRYCALVGHSFDPQVRSVRIEFSVGAQVTSGSVDHLEFGPTGSVPVTLQSFRID